MHTLVDYVHVISATIAHLQKMIGLLPTPNQKPFQEILDFLLKFGCYGYPGSNGKDFQTGSYITQNKAPLHALDVITIVPCFSNDVKIAVPPEADPSTLTAVFFKTDQVIALYDTNHWSQTELALFLFHEARHARHRIGPKLANLPPLEPDAIHEINTWITMLNLLAVWGGKNWKFAIQQEISWLKQQHFEPENPLQIIYKQSGTYRTLMSMSESVACFWCQLTHTCAIGLPSPRASLANKS
jgi:hypothetical protein